VENVIIFEHGTIQHDQEVTMLHRIILLTIMWIHKNIVAWHLPMQDLKFTRQKH